MYYYYYYIFVQLHFMFYNFYLNFCIIFYFCIKFFFLFIMIESDNSNYLSFFFYALCFFHSFCYVVLHHICICFIYMSNFSNMCICKNKLYHFSEENVWKLCQDVATRHGSELQHCYVVFVSNSWRSVPLWRQRAGKDEDKLVVWVSWKKKEQLISRKSLFLIFFNHNKFNRKSVTLVTSLTVYLYLQDFHVILIYAPDERAVVYDLDSALPFPTHFWKYAMETFRSDEVLQPEHHRRFRVIPANVYLREFASDRHHMKREDGTWIKTPPDYPPISTSSTFIG